MTSLERVMTSRERVMTSREMGGGGVMTHEESVAKATTLINPDSSTQNTMILID